jgi:hypothetical protein
MRLSGEIMAAGRIPEDGNLDKPINVQHMKGK